MAADPRLYMNGNDGPGKEPQPPKSDNPIQDGRYSMYWREIERYKRATNDWATDGDSIIDVYMDGTRTQGSSSRKYPLLWANVEVLKPAVYAKVPTVNCTRRYKDKDPIARTAAELMERAANVSIDLYNIDEIFRMVRDDRLLPGRGQAWVRYEAEIEEYETEESTIDPVTGEATFEMVKGQRLIGERAVVDYVHWKDFGHNVARSWADVWVVWRRCYKTQEEISERFGGDVAAKLTYNAKMPGQGSGSEADDPDNRCIVYEIWDKMRGLTAWMAEGHKQFLEIGAPPVEFETGFPCPEPCYATKTSKELIPKPDYAYYRDQAKEINDLTDKIHRLSQWLQVKGFIPNSSSTISDPLQEVLKDKGNAELFVGVDSMTEWAEKGGAAKLIDWLPLDKVSAALQAAINARNQLINDVYQISGIGDIMRGQTDPNETLGAQELKAQTGSRRMRNTKDEISRFCRDISRLMCEVIAEKFQPQTIADMTGFKYIPAQVSMGGQQLFAPGQPMPQMNMGGPMGSGQPGLGHDQMQSNGSDDMVFDDRVIELLRNDRMRGFRIDIETDSTIQLDENAEKQRRMEFLGAIGPYMKQTVEAIQMAPAIAPAMAELLMFAVRGFRAGSGVEESIERSIQEMAKQATIARQQPPPQVAAQQAKIDADAQASQGKLMLQARGQQQSAALEANKQQTDAALEIRKQNLDASLEAAKTAVSAHARVQDRTAQMLSGQATPGRVN